MFGATEHQIWYRRRIRGTEAQSVESISRNRMTERRMNLLEDTASEYILPLNLNLMTRSREPTTQRLITLSNMLYISLPDIIQRFSKPIQLDRLRQEQINARNKRLLLSFRRPQPRQRDDGSWCDILATFESSDLASGFKSIHDWH